MTPIDFEGSNTIFNKPEDMTDEQCMSIPGMIAEDSDSNQLVVTCWELSEDDLKIAMETKRIYCYHFGNYLQPHALTTEPPLCNYN